jgi:hypothetical protein
MNFIKTAVAWLVFSSKDAQAISLSARGFLVLAATWVTIAAGFAHVQLPSDLLTQFIDSTVALIQGLLMIVSIVVTICGLIRKIARTIDGTNQVLQ